MLIEGIVAAVVVLALAAALFTMRRSHDDVHSVEGYHRSLLTLEHINAHPAVPIREAPAQREGAVRLASTPSVRVTERATHPVPPVLPPPVDNPEAPVPFDDTEHGVGDPPPRPVVHRDRAMSSMNHRPRRLAAPATAVAAVIVLVIVLVVTGSHTVAPRGHHDGVSAARRSGARASTPRSKGDASTTSTTPAPAVSLPQSSTPAGATYDVSRSGFTLALSATSGACWVEVTSTVSGSTVFAGTLQAGGGETVAATGPVTLIIGAPRVFAASVDGTSVALPPGFATPFTMRFVTAGSPTT